MDKYKSTKEFDPLPTSNNGPTAIRFSNEVGISKTLSVSSIDTEQELREIEILERKTKLLREYKQLAQEIAELETKKVSYCGCKMPDCFV